MTGGPAGKVTTTQPLITDMVTRRVTGMSAQADLAQAGIDLLRPTRKGEPPRPGERFFKPLRQIIESVNDTLKGQLDLERHGGRTIAGVCTRVAQRVLALTAAIWNNDRLDLTIRRSLTAYDH
jgi:DNA-binding transcriptional LysR family regulator